jgi:hypothetical protein
VRDFVKEIYLFDRTEKAKCWGDGPWLNEPDIVVFRYKGLRCRVIRIFVSQPEGMFGGHLCAYVCLPRAHPAHGKDYSELDVEVHGGLTHSAYDAHGRWILGFDCAHYCDIVPSVRLAYEKFASEFVVLAAFRALQSSYKTVSFVVDQTKKLADQLFQLSSAVEQRPVKATVLGSNPGVGE